MKHNAYFCIPFLLMSSIAYGGAEANKNISLSYGLNFFGWENSIVASSRYNDSFGFGLRLQNMSVVKDKEQNIAAIAMWHPLSGSFFVEGGLGMNRYYKYSDDKTTDNFSYEARLGNRWVFPSGLSLGVNYAGITSSIGMLLVAGEAGYSF